MIDIVVHATTYQTDRKKKRLRYKDFQLVARPGGLVREMPGAGSEGEIPTGLSEIHSVKEFAARMESLGVFGWWRKGMGYAGSEDRM